jgi:hypothetical protein
MYYCKLCIVFVVNNRGRLSSYRKKKKELEQAVVVNLKKTAVAEVRLAKL